MWKVTPKASPEYAAEIEAKLNDGRVILDKNVFTGMHWDSQLEGYNYWAAADGCFKMEWVEEDSEED